MVDEITKEEDKGRAGEETLEDFTEPNPSARRDANLVRLLKQIVISDQGGKDVDTSVVSSRFFTCYNLSLLSKNGSDYRLSVGVTSARPQEGKSLVAANLAVSLAMTEQHKTVLIDLNLRAPRVHSIFKIPRSPGLAEALDSPVVHVYPTSIDHLYAVPAGSLQNTSRLIENVPFHGNDKHDHLESQSGDVRSIVPFRDILYSLRRDFDFVIVDMPALQRPIIPVLLTHQLSGLLVVVDANRTKHRDLEVLFRKVSESQVIGFVFNRARRNHFE